MTTQALTLVALSAITGVAMLWVFRKTSNQEQIRAVKRRVGAHLLELRVFQDEPAVMWRAQISLLTWNLRYLGLMLMPALWMGLPLAIGLVWLDSYYGHTPLRVGEETVVTVSLQTPLDAAGPALELAAPAGIAVETPAVRVPDQRQASWRIRPLAPVSGVLRLTIGGRTVEKKIEAGGGPRFVAPRRVQSLMDLVRHPGESRIDDPGVEWIEIQYPEASMEILGFRMHWLIWFTVVSMVAALLLKRPMGVVL